MASIFSRSQCDKLHDTLTQTLSRIEIWKLETVSHSTSLQIWPFHAWPRASLDPQQCCRQTVCLATICHRNVVKAHGFQIWYLWVDIFWVFCLDLGHDGNGIIKLHYYHYLKPGVVRLISYIVTTLFDTVFNQNPRRNQQGRKMDSGGVVQIYSTNRTQKVTVWRGQSCDRQVNQCCCFAPRFTYLLFMFVSSKLKGDPNKLNKISYSSTHILTCFGILCIYDLYGPRPTQATPHRNLTNHTIAMPSVNGRWKNIWNWVVRFCYYTME